MNQFEEQLLSRTARDNVVKQTSEMIFGGLITISVKFISYQRINTIIALCL